MFSRASNRMELDKISKNGCHLLFQDRWQVGSQQIFLPTVQKYDRYAGNSCKYTHVFRVKPFNDGSQNLKNGSWPYWISRWPTSQLQMTMFLAMFQTRIPMFYGESYRMMGVRILTSCGHIGFQDGRPGGCQLRLCLPIVQKYCRYGCNSCGNKHDLGSNYPMISDQNYHTII